MSLHRFFDQFSTPIHVFELGDIIALYFGLALSIFVARSLITWLMRLFGLYHIDHYHYWPNLIPWRSVLKCWMRFIEWQQEVFVFGKRASGGFLKSIYISTLIYRPSHLPVGRLMIYGIGLLMPVGIKIKRHVVLLGQTGSGKSSYLTLILSIWKSSAFYIDPKGEITKLLKDRLKKKLHIIAPYDHTLNNATWNIFDEIRAAEKREGNPDIAVRIAVKTAEAMIKKEEGEKNPVFPASARNLWEAIILHVYTAHKPQDHDLITCYLLLCRGYWWVQPNSKAGSHTDPIITMLLTMQSNNAYDGFIAQQASTILRENPNTRGNIFSTAQSQLIWLGFPEVRPVLKGSSTFLCEDLKYRDDMYLALVAPASSLRTELAPLSKLLTNLATFTFESIPGNKKIPCLFAIDEFQAQGYNEYIETSAPLMRGYGILAVYCVQDLGGLDAVYNKTAGGFTGNADAVLCLPSNHDNTLESISRRLGQHSINDKDKNGEKIKVERDVMDVEQVKRFLNFERGNVIVDRSGARPLKLKRLNYFTDLPVSHYNKSNEHKESLFKWLFRSLHRIISSIFVKIF